MSSPQTIPLQHTPLTQAVFADTSFLLHLIGISQDSHSTPSTVRAEVRFDELRTANSDGDGDACCYWSPMVFNEVLYTAAKALIKVKTFQKDYEKYRRIETHDFDVQAMITKLKADPEYKKRHRIPPWFTAEVLPFVQFKLQAFQKHLRKTDEHWLANECTIEKVMSWGKLDPADCVIAVAAARSDAKILLTYDKHFENAKQNLKEHLGLEIIHD
jgi:predicted nucleic acid-binding protein